MLIKIKPVVMIDGGQRGTDDDIGGLLALFLLVIAHGWRNNAMMAYAEHKVYDDSEAAGNDR